MSIELFPHVSRIARPGGLSFIFPALRPLAAACGIFLLAPAAVQASPLLYMCDAEKGQITIQNFPSDDTGSCEKALLGKAKVSFALYDPLDYLPDYQNGEPKPFNKSCTLQKQTYQIKFEPSGNLKAQGECDAKAGASVKIYRNNKELASAVFGKACGNAPATTQLIYKKGAKAPLIKQVTDEKNLVPDLLEQGRWRNVTVLDELAYKACKQGDNSGLLWKFAITHHDENMLATLIAESKKSKDWGDALIQAIQAKDNALLDKLLASGANPNVRHQALTEESRTPLQEAACTADGMAFVETLLKHGAKNSIGDSGDDALSAAINCNQMAVFDKLLESGARMDNSNLASVIMTGDDAVLAEAFAKLLKHGLNPNLRLTLGIFEASGVGEGATIQTGPKSGMKTERQSLLALAKEYGKPKLAAVLVQAGAVE